MNHKYFFAISYFDNENLTKINHKHLIVYSAQNYIYVKIIILWSVIVVISIPEVKSTFSLPPFPMNHLDLKQYTFVIILLLLYSELPTQ